MRELIKECKRHGMTTHALSNEAKRPRARCRKCAVEAVQKRREKVKNMAVELFGRECHDCGLSTKHNSVYDFHHKDPNQKDFGIATYGHTRSWERVKTELDKCVMLCANCHRIRHSQ